MVDTEDFQKRCLAQDDGTLVTEQKKTTEHQEFYDQPLPEKDDNSTGSQEQIVTTVSILYLPKFIFYTYKYTIKIIN